MVVLTGLVANLYLFREVPPSSNIFFKFKTPIITILTTVFEIWDLEFGTWDLKFGIQNLGFGT